jgi:RHS repeat-associated protein
MIIDSFFKARARVMQFFAAAGLILCVLVVGAQAQGEKINIIDDSTPPGLAKGTPAGSYSLSGFDTSNPYNGSLNFSLPLLKMGGRGSAGYTMTLPIEQKWVVDHAYPAAGPVQPTTYTLNPNWWDFQGIKVGLGAGTVQARSNGVGGYACADDSWRPRYQDSYTRLTVMLPDGTEFELRDKLTGGKPFEAYINAPCSGTGFDRGRVFTTDGSSATFVSDEEIRDSLYSDGPGSPYAVSGYLYLRDGTRYHVMGGVFREIRDRNGNTVTITADSFSTVTSATDSIGRQVTIEYNVADPAFGTGTRINFKGFGGARRSIFITYDSLENALRADYPRTKTTDELFGLHITSASPLPRFNPPVATSVWLPDGQRRYRFYYNPYGELARVELPTGGAYEYDYLGGVKDGPDTGLVRVGDLEDAPSSSEDLQVYRRLVKRRVYVNATDTVPESTTTTSRPESYGPTLGVFNTDGYVDVEQHAGWETGPLLSKERHYYYGSAPATMHHKPGGLSEWREGREYKTEVLDTDGTTVLRRTELAFRQREPVSWWGWWKSRYASSDLGEEPVNDTRVVTTITTLEPSEANRPPRANQVTKSTSVDPRDASGRTVGFDRFNDPTDVWEYDFGTGRPGPLLRHTHTEYLSVNAINGEDYTGTSPTPGGVYLRGLPVRQSVYDGEEVERARTTYEYDNYAADAGNSHAPLLARDDIFGLCMALDASGSCASPSSPAYTTRGNVTSETGYLLANDGAVTGTVTSYKLYDVAGNVVRVVDALGHTAGFDFTDRFGSPDSEARDNAAPSELVRAGGKLSYAFATKATNALGHTAYTQFDYYTGQLVNAEDANGTVASTHYDDPLDRPTKAERAVNVPDLRAQTSVTYDDAARTVTTTGDLNSLEDNLLKGEAVYDGLGRTTEARKYETPAQYIATLTVYDALGRPFKTSNPYRPAPGETPVWTTTAYDALGRVTSTTTPDGARACTLYDGARTLVTDQENKQRISRTDALGRLTDVWEVTAADAETEAVSFPVPPGSPAPNMSAGYRTSYSYDASGRLLKVRQGQQRRYFAYDSLGRLIRARNPEQDAPENLALPGNMLSTLSDNNNSWSVKYEYDELGNLKRRTDARGSVADYSYDALNRIQSRVYSGQAAGATPPVSYKYDDPAVTFSKGRLTSVDNEVSVYRFTAYDELGRVKGSSQTTDGVTYSMPDYRYNLAGSLVSEQYPSGRVVKTDYDAAGRVAGVKNQATGLYYAGAAPTDSTDRIHYYAHGAVSAMRLGNGLWEHTSFNTRLQVTRIGLGTSGDDSSVLRLDYAYGTTDNNGNPRTQTIIVPGAASPFVQTYTYDALSRLQSAEEIVGTTSNWKQVYSYDRYGNRSLASGTTLPAALDASTNPSSSTATNRLTSAGHSYDAAGDLLCDPAHPCAPSPFAAYYSYDGEGRMVSAGGGFEEGGAAYAYDAEGRRVRKAVSGAETTLFVYDAMGRVVAEYSNLRGGGGTSYLTSDALGSTRAVTGAGDAVKERHDYLPFGEEVGADNSWRMAARGYGVGDGVREKFTGYQRDNESDLDFAQARMYGYSYGRFTSPDNFTNATHTSNPQSWNLYAYVTNNPLLFTDSTGMSPTDFIDNKGNRTHIEDGLDQVLYASKEDVEKLQEQFVNDRAVYERNIGWRAESSDCDCNLHMTSAQLDNLAGVIYAEASNNATPGEAAGIYGVLNNRASADGNSILDQATSSAGAFGASEKDKIFSKYVSEDKRRAVYLGIIISVLMGTDYSNGAYYWQGTDFSRHTKGSRAYEDYYLVGFHFTDSSHDIWKLGDHNSGNKKWNYKYESTTAQGQTTFMKLTDAWIKAHGANNWRGTYREK